MKNFIEALFKQNEVIDFRYKETTSLFVSTKFHSYFLFFFFDNMEDMVDMMECSGDIWTCLKEQRNIYNNNMDKNTLCICCLEVSDEEYYKTEETCGLSDLSKYIGKIEEDLSYFSKHVLTRSSLLTYTDLASNSVFMILNFSSISQRCLLIFMISSIFPSRFVITT